MRFIKPVLWTVFGVVIGAAAVLSADRVQAESQPAFFKNDRLTITFADIATNWGRLAFIKDTKSPGCWVASANSNGGGFQAIAVAPPMACD
jgi:hypothetical protein